LSAIFSLWLWQNSAVAAIAPSVITYQGKVLVSGSPASSTLSMKFVLYDSLTGGTALYTASGTLPTTSTISITPSSGIFSVDLGGSGTNTIDPTIFQNNSSVYLEVTIGSQTLTPRKQITAAPYAFNAKYLDGLATSSFAKLGSNETVTGTWTFSATTTMVTTTVSGRLGIGTTTPDQALTVVGSISNPVNGNSGITEIATLSTGNDPFAIFVSGRYAYVANSASSTMTIIDISKPTVPVQVATVSVGNSPRSVFVSGRYAYVGNYGHGTISIVDVSNPFSPVVVATQQDLPGIPSSIFISGRYLYTTLQGQDILAVVDISDPLTPVLAAAVTVGDYPQSVFVSGRYAYVANRASGTISVVDISNPLSPVQIATTSVGVWPSSIAVSGRYAYVAHDSDLFISVVDVSNPAIPVQVATTSVGFVQSSVFVSGRYAYFSTGITANDLGNLSVVDILNPLVPVLVATTPVGKNPQSVFVSGRYAYVANAGPLAGNGGENTISIIDLSGAEFSTLIAHSAEVGQIQSRNDIIAQGIVGANSLQIGSGGILSNGPISITATDTYSYFGGGITATGTVTTTNLAVIGNATFGGTLSLGNTDITGNLTVSGNATTTGNQVISGTLNISGTSTLVTTTATALTVTGTSTLTNISSTGISNLGTLNVSGSTILSGTLNVTGTSTLATTTISKLTISSQGIIISSSTPVVTSSTLYNVGDTLYWNGNALSTSTGSGLPSSIDGQILFSAGSTWTATSAISIVSTTGNVGIGTTNPGTLLTVHNTNIASATSSTLKQSYLSVDQMALSQLEGGAYFGRTKIKNNNWVVQVADNFVLSEAPLSMKGSAGSADGEILAIVLDGNQIGLFSGFDADVQLVASVQNWEDIAMSVDGKIMSAVIDNGGIHRSIDYGATWATSSALTKNWTGIAMSADGKYQTAVATGDSVYISADFGVTWIAKDSSRAWTGVAMSSDGKLQIATVSSTGNIYLSVDYGSTWVAKASANDWDSVVMSADGRVVLAGVNSGNLYLSTNYGYSWTTTTAPTGAWSAVGMDGDGKYQVAGISGGALYISGDYGSTWATSTSATSGVWYDIDVTADGATVVATDNVAGYYINQADQFSLKNIAIGATTVASGLALDVTGVGSFSGNLSVGGGLTVTGNATSTNFIATGNVGIGTTTLTERLNVKGNINLVGNLNLATGTIKYSGSNLLSITGGASSVALGVNAGHSATGTGNVFVGSGAGQNNDSGYNNTFIGLNAGQTNTSSAGNTFIGATAGASNTSGSSNVFVGSGAGGLNTTGLGNSFFGAQVASANTSGSINSFFGAYAGIANTEGGNNSFFGAYAGTANITGNYNVFIGEYAGSSVTSGYSNTFLGARSGYLNIIGAGNVFLGNQAGYNETGSNKLYIANSNTDSPLIYGDFSASALTINGSLTVSSTNTSTFNSSINITSGCFAVGGNCLSDGTTLNTTVLNVSSTLTTNSTTILVGNNYFNFTGANIGGNDYASLSIGNGASSTNGAVAIWGDTTVGPRFMLVATTSAPSATVGDSPIFVVDMTSGYARVDIGSTGNAKSGLLRLYDNAGVNKIYLSASSTDGDSFVLDNFLVGANSESIANTGFVLTNNNSLYTEGDLGVNGNIYTDGAIYISGTSTLAITTITALTVSGDVTLSTSTIFLNNVGSFTSSTAFIFNVANFSLSAADRYILSLRSNNAPVFSVSANGDVNTVGSLHAFSATVGADGNPGDLAERVDIAVDDIAEAGDVVVVDPNNIDTYRRSSEAYSQSVAGVISTAPTIVVGDGKTDYTAVMAMIGRVPVKISSENGAIKRGDLLVSASLPGYAMKYNPEDDNGLKMVGIVGVALDSFADVGGTGKIMALIRTGWVNSRGQTINDIKSDLETLAQSQGVNINSNPSDLTVEPSGGNLVYSSGNLNLHGGSLLGVAAISGLNGRWEINADGWFITRVDTTSGQKEMYGLQSPAAEFVFSSSSQLMNGEARVTFDVAAQEIIDTDAILKVSVTLTSGEAMGVYVTDKNATGFTVKEVGNGTSNATFDWVVVVKQKDPNTPVSAPVSEPIIDTPVSSGDSSGSSTTLTTETPLVIESTTTSTTEPAPAPVEILTQEPTATVEPTPETTPVPEPAPVVVEPTPEPAPAPVEIPSSEPAP